MKYANIEALLATMPEEDQVMPRMALLMLPEEFLQQMDDVLPKLAVAYEKGGEEEARAELLRQGFDPMFVEMAVGVANGISPTV